MSRKAKFRKQNILTGSSVCATGGARAQRIGLVSGVDGAQGYGMFRESFREPEYVVVAFSISVQFESQCAQEVVEEKQKSRE